MGDKWLITSGLTPGDRVIVEGMQKVRPGVTPKAVPFVAQVAKPAEGVGLASGKK
jgi:membrane fusion protein (multidrug efflux system)